MMPSDFPNELDIPPLPNHVRIAMGRAITPAAALAHGPESQPASGHCRAPSGHVCTEPAHDVQSDAGAVPRAA